MSEIMDLFSKIKITISNFCGKAGQPAFSFITILDLSKPCQKYIQLITVNKILRQREIKLAGEVDPHHKSTSCITARNQKATLLFRSVLPKREYKAKGRLQVK